MWIGALALLSSNILCAQDIAGDWQGTLETPGTGMRVVFSIEKGADGGWKATEFAPDKGSNGVAADSVTLEGSNVKLTFGRIRGAYEGKIGQDRTSIAGTWTQGQGRPLPLDLKRATKESSWRRDTTLHSMQFVTVENDVKLEVLDWGGSGRPLVLLHGWGNYGDGHGFDKFAPKLIDTYHVYGITRRGTGASSAPAPTSVNYSADRLGDDVLAVIDALNLDRPVLVGHSLGGQELSSVGSRHPEKVAGLIYLDAGYKYAYYDRSRGHLNIEMNEVRRKLEQLGPGKMPRDPKLLVRELLETSLPELEKSLRHLQRNLEAAPLPPAASAQPRSAILPVLQAIKTGMQRYTNIRAPILAIYALQPIRGPAGSAARAAGEAGKQMTLAQAEAFETGLPSARVVRLPDASHRVFQSNEADVLREMKAFIGSLP